MPWLLMTWLLASPRHQLPWYWVCKLGNNDFNYLCVISVEEWYELSIHFMLTMLYLARNSPVSKVHGANMGPTWVLSAPDWPHVCPMNLAIRVVWYSVVVKITHILPVRRGLYKIGNISVFCRTTQSTSHRLLPFHDTFLVLCIWLFGFTKICMNNLLFRPGHVSGNFTGSRHRGSSL